MARTSKLQWFRWRVHPSDQAILALLALAVGLALLRWPVVGAGLTNLTLVSLAIFAGFAVAVWAMTRWENSPWVQWVRPLATVGLIISLYPTLGRFSVTAMPYLADATLSRADNWLLGFDPSLALQRWQTPGWVEFFSFIYSAFIPYIYLSLFLGCLGRSPAERNRFLTGWVFTYVISYLGYLFIPAHGPVVYHAADYSVALQGRWFYPLVVNGNEMTGGLYGAFPSLHVGGSVYLCLSDLKTNRLRGLTYLPMVLLIYVSTVFLRYHYVIDLVAGTFIPMACIPLSQWVCSRWSERRVAAGLPALAGGVTGLAAKGEFRREVELRRAEAAPKRTCLSFHPGRAVVFLIRELELVLVGAPLALFGAVSHILPYWIARSIARRFSRDTKQWASRVIYPSSPAFRLLCLLQLTAAWLLVPPMWAAVYTVLLPYASHYALLYGDRISMAAQRLVTFLRRQHSVGLAAS